ncbi:hypothetical protein SY88_09725 [Clostridiales bacterium PH28_bin88]|nr:hypothetical protein SY88_09725 [Clostridiales bacterium PH28_bin88]
MGEQLRDTFLAEAEELLDQIDECLLILERQTQDAGAIDSLFRAFHTLKGSAGIVGCEAVKVLSHGLEDVLDGVRSGRRQVNTELINMLLTASDLLKEAITGIPTGEEPVAEDINELLFRLRQVGAKEDNTIQEAQECADGDENHSFYLLPLSMRLDLLQTLLQGLSVVFVNAKCNQEVFFRGIDPMRMFLSVIELSGARLLNLGLAGEELPGVDDFDPERCYVAIEAYLQLPSEQSVLLEHLEFIRDDADVRLFPLNIPAIFAADLPPNESARETGGLEQVHQLLTGTTWPLDRESIIARLEALVHAGVEAATTLSRSGGETRYLDEAVLLAYLLHECLERGTFDGDGRLMQTVDDVKSLMVEYLDCHGPNCYPGISPRTAAEDLLQLSFPNGLYQMKSGTVSSETAGKSMLPADSPGKAPSPAFIRSEMLRVDSKKIDKLMELADELVIIKNSLEYWLRLAQGAIKDEEQAQALKEQQMALAKVTRELQEGISSVRMVPIGLVFHKFTRYVRDTSLRLHKEVVLVFQGEDTQLDRNVVEKLYEPLLHLVRNSLDHGMEPPEERSLSGKPVQGTIVLRAYHEGTRITVSVEDDGRGINVERVKGKALVQGLVSEEEAAQMSHEEVLSLIFRPGLSTAEEITDISGRGVGMDAVMAAANGLGGSVSVDSVPGRGTRFKISVPLTVTTSRVLIVKAGTVELGISVDEVERIVHLSREQLADLGGAKLVTTPNGSVPLIGLAEVVGFPWDERGEEYRVILLRNGVGFQVKTILGDEDVVIRKVSGEIGELPLYKGAALRGNGKVLMVLDSQYLKGWLGRGL